MKKLILLLLIFSGATMMAQEGVTMNRSKTLKIEEVPPTWPGCTGKVVVDMLIDKQGKPVINKVSGGTPGMQKAVRDAIMTIPELKPGNVGGTKKDSKLTLPFQF